MSLLAKVGCWKTVFSSIPRQGPSESLLLSGLHPCLFPSSSLLFCLLRLAQASVVPPLCLLFTPASYPFYIHLPSLSLFMFGCLTGIQIKILLQSRLLFSCKLLVGMLSQHTVESSVIKPLAHTPKHKISRQVKTIDCISITLWMIEQSPVK